MIADGCNKVALKETNLAYLVSEQGASAAIRIPDIEVDDGPCSKRSKRPVANGIPPIVLVLADYAEQPLLVYRCDTSKLVCVRRIAEEDAIHASLDTLGIRGDKVVLHHEIVIRQVGLAELVLPGFQRIPG